MSSANKDTSTLFIYYLLVHHQYKIYSLQCGGAQPHVYPKDIKNLTFFVPDSALEQQQIAGFLSAIDEKIELVSTQSKRRKFLDKGSYNSSSFNLPTSMSTQSRNSTRTRLVAQLQTLGWEKIPIKNEDDLVDNLKTQLEIHNQITFSDKEFQDILTRISVGDIFDKSKRLRGTLDYQKDNGDIGYLSLVDSINWCKNEFQVTRQVEMEGIYKNRYDVTC